MADSAKNKIVGGFCDTENIYARKKDNEKKTDLDNIDTSQGDEQNEKLADIKGNSNIRADTSSDLADSTAADDFSKDVESSNPDHKHPDKLSGLSNEQSDNTLETNAPLKTVHPNQQRIENKSRIDNQTIEQHIHHYYDSKSESQNNADTIADPTVPLPEKPVQLPNFQANDQIERYARNLINENILVCSCHDDDLLLSAAYLLIETPALDYFEKRMLVFEGRNQNKDDISLDCFTQTKIGQGSKVVIITKVTSRLFLDALFASLLYAEGTKSILKDKEIILLCLVNNELLQESLKNRTETFNFRHWNIPFLRHLLSQEFSGDELADLETKILELRGVGLWGEYSSDTDFYNYTVGYLRENGKKFSGNVKKWHKDSKEMSRADFLNSINVVKPDEIFKHENKITSAVLYIATFFPGLTPPQFNILVEVLLAELKDYKETESIENTESGEKKTVKNIEERPLIEVWKDKCDLILSDFHLYAKSGNKLIIEFSIPYLRKELESYLRKYYPNFLYQQFEKIHLSGMFFQQQVPEKIIKRLTSLTVTMTLFDQESYGSDWLLHIVQSIDKHIKLDLPSGTQGDFEELIAFIASKVEVDIRNQFYSRLSELIREMLDHSELESTVRSFFEKMIGTSHHDAALIITLEISKRLKYAPHFKGIYWMWMKRILNEGQKDIKEKAYITLQNNAIYAGNRIYQYLDNIMPWLPSSDDFNKYSPANVYALQFLLEYCIRSVMKFNLKEQGNCPSTYPLFIELNSNNLSSERIENLVKWLFHPGLEFVLPNIFKESEITEILLQYILADLIEEWLLILLGDDSESKDEAIVIAEKIVFYIVHNTGRVKHRLLLGRWRNKRKIYLKEMSEMDIVERNKKKALARKRKNIIKLEKIFKQCLKNYNRHQRS